MNFPQRIRQIAYHPFVVKVSQFFHVRNSLRWLYYMLARPKNKKRKISFSGIEALFYVHTPLDLRLVETPFEKGMGDERFLLGKILDNLTLGDVVYDVGASIGIHTVFMAKKVGKRGKVIAFEPEDISYNSLQSNIRLNSLKNVDSIKIALGNNFSESMLYSFGGTADFSLIERFKDKPASKVSIVPGDILVRDKKLPLPKVVKIDVEGFEYYVIRGLQTTLSDRTCKLVCCEIHPVMLPYDIKLEMVVELLKSYGFNHIEIHTRGESVHSFCYKSKL